MKKTYTITVNTEKFINNYKGFRNELIAVYLTNKEKDFLQVLYFNYNEKDFNEIKDIKTYEVKTLTHKQVINEYLKLINKGE